MEYYEAANRLYDLGRFGIRPGTESTADVLAHLGDPHEAVETVQIAGSNGKGSTARMLESILREAGLSVGLYTSPHLEDMRERVRVDGRMIPKAAVARFVEACDDYLTERGAAGESPTFFEMSTAMALWHFAREDVDVAVLEVGIGGKLDATSVVDPVASAVTSVTLEHTGLLGDTIEEIARDKAHVAGDHPLVTAAAGNALAAVREVADEVVTVGRGDGSESGPESDGGPDVRVEYGGRANHAESRVTIATADGSVETRVAAIGAHQAENAGIAATLARQVADVSDDALARGLRNAHWPGRFEVMGTEPLVVLDGAHNPDACERLAETLSTFEYDDLHLVFGAMHDKDHRAMAAALPTPDAAVACRPTNPRSVEPAVLARVFENAGVEEVRTVSAVQDALASALEAAGPDDCVVVAGSLYAIAEARTRYTVSAAPTRVRDLDDARETLERAGVTGKGVWRMRGKAVHRVVRLRLQARQAAYLKQELLSVGGECALSGLQREEQLVEAVCTGTLAQFKRLLEKLEAQPYGLAEVGRELRETLGIRIDPPEPRYPWQERTAVMGICNVTPDSFHDGGEYDAPDDAVARAEAMVEAGADVVDVGGESTRPGAEPVPVGAEIDRVVPAIERIADLDPVADGDVLVSVDTRKAAVAEAALEAGADVLNDVSGLEDPEMRFVAAEHDVPLIVMHSLETPVDPDRDVEYDDVVDDVIAELGETVLLAEKAGLDREQIVVDPGLGFGKSARESFEVLGRLDELRALGCPILVGHSHKSMFGFVGQGPGERRDATVAASAIAADRGADLVRVHDVPENVAAVKTALAARDPAGVGAREDDR
ncbi:dihydropteroate synthase [Halovivax sp.]|uniref:dihydropteroate synthase n=1 Tax=Halovivax sp. TaxID=1935978 RepID=UPI0025BCF7D9|nr:dihydropteroate synthase [Halovivax sp.]